VSVSIGQAELIEQTVTGLGYELVDFETSPRARLLRIFIDSPNGITIDDCASVSNHLTRLFAVENIDYDRLEVSSPGLDRPLKKPADFERFAGQEAQVRARVPINGQRNFAGILAGVKDGVLHLQSADTVYELPLEQIDKARLVPKF
jgi:ribosome maturation factor RimP